MKQKYYVVDEDEIKIRKALLDLDSNEWYHQFESEDGVKHKDPVACSRCKMVKYYNELTNDERIRTGKSYKEQNIFDNEQDAATRMKTVIREKANKIQHKINELAKEREHLIDLLFQI